MKKSITFFVFLISLTCGYAQKVIFLHHSTGDGVYTEGNVPQWISNYNAQHGTNYQVFKRPYPDTPYPWANYPYDYWNLWVNNQCNNTNPNIECLDKLTQNYDVIIFKHCYPGSSIQPDLPVASVSSSVKTLANYKLQYRALRSLMDSYPNKKFIIWTLAPLHRLETYNDEPAKARQFVDWVKTSWLTEDGKSHPNIYIFDFFGYAAESNPAPVNGKFNCLKYDYEVSHTADNNSHPNTLANQTIGPIFAEFIVNTIKNQLTGFDQNILNRHVQIYPNPASVEATIDLTGLDFSDITIEIFDLSGNLTHLEALKNQPLVRLSTNELKNGIYIVRTKTGLNYVTSKLYIVK
jgi:hypothetical protein